MSTLLSAIAVAVPATTANIGPGFDCLGLALSLHNRFTFALLESDSSALVATGRDAMPIVLKAIGDEADRVQLDANNLVYQAVTQVFEKLGKPVPPMQIDIQLGVPLARGLGSSATAIVGGIVGANRLAGSLLSTAEMLQLAIALEGHPDNVVPALLGGCRLAATNPATTNPAVTNPVATNPDQAWQICDVPWHEAIVPIVAIPNFELSTAEARRVLPTHYTRADAIFNTAHLGLLVRGLATGNGDWLRAALGDRIHQPYRQALIVGYQSVWAAALQAGAYGLVISGAGPTLLALAEPSVAQAVRAAMLQAWQAEGVTAKVEILAIDHQGASIL
jgi:homoserine kinase